jgi:hypothetical protein
MTKVVPPKNYYCQQRKTTNFQTGPNTPPRKSSASKTKSKQATSQIHFTPYLNFFGHLTKISQEKKTCILLLPYS